MEASNLGGSPTATAVSGYSQLLASNVFKDQIEQLAKPASIMSRLHQRLAELETQYARLAKDLTDVRDALRLMDENPEFDRILTSLAKLSL